MADTVTQIVLQELEATALAALPPGTVPVGFLVDFGLAVLRALAPKDYPTAVDTPDVVREDHR